jgi:hypothetical protein
VRFEAANECCPVVVGTEPVLGSSLWEGEAPAEPDVSFQCSVIAKPAPVGADAPAVSGSSALRKLRPPRIAVNTSGNAVCSCAQDFALILFWGPRKNAEECGKHEGEYAL